MSVFGDAELFEEFEIQSVKPDESDSSSESGSDAEDCDEPDEKYKELLAENEKLKRTLRLLERPACIKVKDASKDGPIAHVILFNNHISRKFQDEIQDFFCELCSRRIRDSDQYPDIKPPFVQYLSPRDEKDYRNKRSSKRTEAITKAFQGFSSIQVYDKFFIDHLGQPLYFQDPAHSEWIFPRYDSVEFEPLSGDVEGSTRSKKRVQRMCFNCGESDHQIKDCDKPRDQQAINIRRQKFLNEVAKFTQGSPQIRLDGQRYHQEDDGAVENKEKFAKFKPGVISAELQEALGMKEDDFPPYVYQMRRVGYPPGHLYSARMVDSGLSLYEEGEINGRVQDNKYEPVDIGKIISYPGFNQPPLPGQQDKFEENGVYPICQEHSKEVMVSYYEHRNSLFYQQKAIEDQNRANKQQDSRDDVLIEEVDMDMADDDTVLERPRSGGDFGNTADMEDGEVQEIAASAVEIISDVVDLTEDELEEQRHLLLKELERSNSNNNDSDYRNIKSSDQDYRIIQSEYHEIAAEDTPQSPDQNELLGESSAQEVITVQEEIDLPSESVVENTPVSLKERSMSSDTDYRVPPPSFEVDQLVASESPAESSKTSIDTTTVDNEEDGQRLPERHKFAKGISKFDDYFTESKSQGVYNKLRVLLKDSPRRQEK